MIRVCQYFGIDGLSIFEVKIRLIEFLSGYDVKHMRNMTLREIDFLRFELLKQFSHYDGNTRFIGDLNHNAELFAIRIIE
jgi:hypothetical protein